MLVKPRPRPPVIADIVDRTARSGRFYLQDIYQGLAGVERGEVKWLRVLEETSRISERTDGPNPYNQTFLLSSALAFSVKNYLGVVPVRRGRISLLRGAGGACHLSAGVGSGWTPGAEHAHVRASRAGDDPVLHRVP